MSSKTLKSHEWGVDSETGQIWTQLTLLLQKYQDATTPSAIITDHPAFAEHHERVMQAVLHGTPDGLLDEEKVWWEVAKQRSELRTPLTAEDVERLQAEPRKRQPIVGKTNAQLYEERVVAPAKRFVEVHGLTADPVEEARKQAEQWLEEHGIESTATGGIKVDMPVTDDELEDLAYSTPDPEPVDLPLFAADFMARVVGKADQFFDTTDLNHLPFGGATTFEDYETWVLLREKAQELYDLKDVFDALLLNLLSDPDLSVDQKKVAINGLVAEFKERLKEVTDVTAT